MITLYRYINYPGLCVMGGMVIDGKPYYTLEPRWKDNQRNISCIPPGEYEVEFMPRSWSGKYRNCFHVKDVPGRSQILIHAGNVPDHTRGCILIGKRHGWLAGKPAVLSSAVALRQFAENVEDCFKLRVVSWIG